MCARLEIFLELGRQSFMFRDPSIDFEPQRAGEEDQKGCSFQRKAAEKNPKNFLALGKKVSTVLPPGD